MPSTIKKSLELVEIYGTFIALAETEKVNPKGIPFRLAWEISDVKESFKKHASRYEEERAKIFAELGKQKGVDTGSFEVEVDNVPIINSRIKELNTTVVEVDFVPIAIGRFEAADGFQFAPGAFETLRKNVIEFPAEKKKEEPKV